MPRAAVPGTHPLVIRRPDLRGRGARIGVIECHQTPHEGCNYTQSRAPRQLWHLMRARRPKRHGLFSARPSDMNAASTPLRGVNGGADVVISGAECFLLLGKSF